MNTESVLTPRDNEALTAAATAMWEDPDAPMVARMEQALREAHLIGSVLVSEWLTCSCGKEYHAIVRDTTPERAGMMMRLKRMSVCRRCEADHGRGMDACPEHTERGACSLTWAHTARCEPYPPVPEYVHRIAAANGGKGVPVLYGDPACTCGHPYSQHATLGLGCELDDGCEGWASS